MKNKVFKNIQTYHPLCIALNNFLADHPEISGEEYESSKKIVTLLSSQGFTVEYPFAGFETAFKAVKGMNKHNRKIALLVEYDALPEIGHACGHCVSGAISVLAGLSIVDFQEELDADIHIIGTPVEETDGAKCTMCENGIFDEYDMAMMIHLYDRNLIDLKLICLDSYLFSFKGKSAHAAAAPWEGHNALNGAQLMMHAIDMLRQHVTPDVRLHAIYRNGGAAPNIVPESASIELYSRALERENLNHVNKMIEDCAHGAAIATQTTYTKIATAKSYDNLKSLPTGNALLAESYGELGLEIANNAILFGSSDVGNVSMICPTFQPTLAIVPENTAIHTRDFANAIKSEAAYKAIQDGAQLITMQIMKIFTNDTLLTTIKKEFLQ